MSISLQQWCSDKDKLKNADLHDSLMQVLKSIQTRHWKHLRPQLEHLEIVNDIRSLADHLGTGMCRFYGDNARLISSAATIRRKRARLAALKPLGTWNQRVSITPTSQLTLSRHWTKSTQQSGRRNGENLKRMQQRGVVMNIKVAVRRRGWKHWQRGGG